MSLAPRAVVIEDEPLARARLVELLGQLWPELAVAQASDGDQGLRAIVEHNADIAFIDLRLPGASGAEVAAAVADRCHLVFVTAHDDHLRTAFDQDAVDYLLKPVSPDRLGRTVERLRRRLGRAPDPRLQDRLARWRQGEPPPGDRPPMLRWLQAGVRDQVRVIATADVVYFEADAKYTRLVCRDHDAPVRLSIRDHVSRLDADQFWQIHRSYVVNVAEIDVVLRRLGGAMQIQLRSRPEKLPVSQAYQRRFKVD